MLRSLALALVLAASHVDAQASWTGSVNSLWSEPGNWSTALVPDANTSVAIADASVLLDVPGAALNVVLSGSALLDLGAQVLDVHGHWDSSGGTARVQGTGELRLQGSGDFVTGSNRVGRVRVDSGAACAMGPALLEGDLVIEGSLDVNAGGVRVEGDLNSTGSIGWNGDGVHPVLLEVDGDASVGDGPNSAPPGGASLRVGGNLVAGTVSNFQDGWIELDGGAATLDVRDAGNLRVLGGPKQWVLPAQEWETTSTRQLQVLSGGALDLGAQDVFVSGDLDITAPGAQLTSAGWLRFSFTDATIASGTNELPDVWIEGNANLAPSRLSGDLRLEHASLELFEGTVQVAGDLTMTGGQLSWNQNFPGQASVLDVEGGIALEQFPSWNAQGLSPAPTVRCAGDFFAPGLSFQGGRVELDGAFGGELVLDLSGDLIVKDARSLQAYEFGTNSVFGSLVVESGGALHLGDHDLRVQGTVDASAAGAVVDGAGFLVLDFCELTTGPNAVGSVRCLNGCSMREARIGGDLEIVFGELSLFEDILEVEGDVRLDNGFLAFESEFGLGPWGLDVEGALSIANSNLSTQGQPVVVRCAGDYSNDGSTTFEGWIELDGGTSSSIAAVWTRNLRIASGTKRLGAHAGVGQGLEILGGATLALDGFELELEGALEQTAAGASMTGPGVLVLSNAAVVRTGANSVPAVRVEFGSPLLESVRIAGPLDFASGTQADLGQVRVQGQLHAPNALLSAVEVSPGAGALLDVEGDVLLEQNSFLTTGSTPFAVHCAGNWSSSADVSIDNQVRVRLDGGAATLDAAFLPQLEVAGGPKLLQAALLIPGDLQLLANAQLDLGTHELRLGGSYDATAAGADMLGSGTVVLQELSGSSNRSVATGSGSLPNLRLESSFIECAPTRIDGDLELDQSTLEQSAGLLEVGGRLQLVASQLQAPASQAPVQLHCAGDVDVDLASQTGDVALTLLGGAASLDVDQLRSLVVQGGPKTLVDELDVADDVLVEPGASLELSEFELSLGGDWDSSGASVTGSGSIVLQPQGGPAASFESGSSPVPALRVASGEALLRSFRSTGDLRCEPGTLIDFEDGPFEVGGDAHFQDSFVTFLAHANQRLEVAGDLECADSFLSAVPGSTPELHCVGDLRLDDEVVLPNAPVVLGASGAAQDAVLRTNATPAEAPAQLGPVLILGGARRLEADTALDAASLRLEPGASLDLDTHSLRVERGPFEVAGSLALEAGSELLLGPSVDLSVERSGSLSLVGSPLAPARIAAHAGGGYSCSIEGSLRALFFAFEDPGPEGVRIAATAELAPAPHDLRAGVFRRPSPLPGSTLLEIAVPQPRTLAYLDFEDPLGQGTHNLRCPGGAPLVLQNAGGDFAGFAFEDDPLGLVSWPPPVSTSLLSFQAQAGPEQNAIEWMAEVEFDAALFTLESAPSPSGPFAPLAKFAPQGAGASYAFTHGPLAPEQPVHYRLVQLLEHGAQLVLASASATPYDASLPANVLDVGPGARFATIQAAVDAANGGTTLVRVAPGSYPSFAIDAPPGALHLVAEAGVSVDTGSGPVVVRNVGPASSVQLSGFLIGGALTTHPALSVESCSGLVLLDELQAIGGLGQAGLRLSSSASVVLQDCVASGNPGLDAVASRLWASRGALSLLALDATSSAELCELDPQLALAPGSQLTSLPGPMPQADSAATVALGQDLELDLQAAPANAWLLATSPALAAPGLGLFPLEMPLLLDVFGLQLVGGGLTDALGQAHWSTAIPAVGSLSGAELVLQAALVQGSGALRASTLTRSVLVP